MTPRAAAEAHATMPHPVMEMYEPGDSIGYLEIENDADGGAGHLLHRREARTSPVRVVGGSGTGVSLTRTATRSATACCSIRRAPDRRPAGLITNGDRIQQLPVGA